jgi:Pectate lyase superfamily protein
MAVIQVSQIQIRRGALEELGQLSSGEFGWAIDKLRLFIGNGSIEEGSPYEGNTEILTSNSDILSLLNVYTYKGMLGGYQVQTGVDYLNRVVRTFQEKVDDFVNIKDFGGKGNGFDDDTDAIQRAIFELYARQSLFAPVITRRTINFHPGVYLISRPLLMPPYTCFRNSGKDSVIIRSSGIAADCVFRTTDGAGISVDSEGNALLPTSKMGPIEMSGISFEIESINTPVGIIDSTKGALFHRCQFAGSNPSPSSINNSRGILLTSRVSGTDSIHFTECNFTRSDVGIEINNATAMYDIVVDKCAFANVYQGINVSSNVSTTVAMRVTNSVFSSVAQQGIVTSANVHGVVSAFNTYLNVGNRFDLQTPPVSHVIEFGGNLSYSIADIITRTPEADALIESIKHHSPVAVSTHAGSNMRFGDTYQTIGKSVIVTNSSTNLIPLSTRYKKGIIDYSIERNTVHRSGSIKFSFNPSNQKFEFHDSFVETDQTGVDMSVEYNSSTGLLSPYIICIVDNLGFPAVVTYDIKSLYQ